MVWPALRAGVAMSRSCPSYFMQDAEKARQHEKTVVWLNKIN